MKRINYGIEYAHIYSDQTFSDEQLVGIRHLKRIETKLLNKRKLMSRIVLIDDYSPAVPFDRFPLDTYIKSLTMYKALPDVIVKESDLVGYCRNVLDIMTDPKQKKRILRYIASKNKYPCSLFIAAWYLVRLGAFGVVPVKTIWGNKEKLFSERIVTIVPDYYRTPELDASDIIHSTPFRELEKKIDRQFYYYVRPQHTDWNDFDPFEYLDRNYGRELLVEDRKIITFSIKALLEYKVPIRSLSHVADIGTGPNIYPPMILSPFVSDHGIIELTDISNSNLLYLNETLSYPAEAASYWNKYEKLMCRVGSKIYSGVLQRTLHLAKVKRKSLYDLDADQYDAVTCFFVSEGIHNTLEKFYDATRLLIHSVKEGGIIITAHMIGSRGYFAGERTSFPSTYITVANVKLAFSSLRYQTIKLIETRNNSSIRLGYHGMALMIGRK